MTNKQLLEAFKDYIIDCAIDDYYSMAKHYLQEDVDDDYSNDEVYETALAILMGNKERLAWVST